MQQTGTCPDAAEAFNPRDILEAQDLDALTGICPCETGHSSGGVERRDMVSRLSQGAGIPAGAASGVEDMASRRDVGQKAGVHLAHVHIAGRVEVGGGLLVVVVTHSRDGPAPMLPQNGPRPRSHDRKV